MMMCSTPTRSSLELMLDSIRQRDEQLPDVPPALPPRPVSKARLPPARRRALPVSFQKNDPREIEGSKKGEMESNYEFGVFESKRIKREALDESLCKRRRSVDGDDFAASTKDCQCGNNVGFVLNKIELSDFVDGRREKRAMEGILEIQKYFRGHRARCYYLELKRGTIMMQSFVRGEIARKDYRVLARRLAAVLVIQQHTKKWIEWRTMQKRQKAAICLQSVIRGWLTRRHLNYSGNFKVPDIDPVEDMRKPDWRNPEAGDFIQVSPSAVADLQRRLLRVETELGQKEEENSALRQQIQQFDKKWSEYEAKMKSLEKLWQDQLTSLQMSLATAKKSLASDCTTDQPGTFDPFPIYHFNGIDDTMPMGTRPNGGRTAVGFSKLPCEIEPQQTNVRLNHTNQRSKHRKKASHDNAGIVSEFKSAHSASSICPDGELRKLKLRFEAWTGDYKIRLQETKATLQKLDHLETKKSRKKWWGR